MLRLPANRQATARRSLEAWGASDTRVYRLWRREGQKVPHKKRKRNRLGTSAGGCEQSIKTTSGAGTSCSTARPVAEAAAHAHLAACVGGANNTYQNCVTSRQLEHQDRVSAAGALRDTQVQNALKTYATCVANAEATGTFKDGCDES